MSTLTDRENMSNRIVNIRHIARNPLRTLRRIGLYQRSDQRYAALIASLRAEIEPIEQITTIN